MKSGLPRLSGSQNPWAPGSFPSPLPKSITTLSDSEMMPPPATLTPTQREARRRRWEPAVARTLPALSLGSPARPAPHRRNLTSIAPSVRRFSQDSRPKPSPKLVRVRPSLPLPTTAETSPSFDPSDSVQAQHNSEESEGYKPLERARRRTYRRLLACPYQKEEQPPTAAESNQPPVKR